LGDLLFYSVLSNANIPEPNEPTVECLQVANVSVAWIVLIPSVSALELVIAT
jgi:hypothetical protein